MPTDPRDEPVKIPLDPETAIRALLFVDPNDVPMVDDEPRAKDDCAQEEDEP